MLYFTLDSGGAQVETGSRRKESDMTLELLIALIIAPLGMLTFWRFAEGFPLWRKVLKLSIYFGLTILRPLSLSYYLSTLASGLFQSRCGLISRMSTTNFRFG